MFTAHQILDMKPWRRNALSALEWTFFTPLLPALLYRRRLHLLVCVVQFTAFVWLMSTALLPNTANPAPWWVLTVVLVVCWLFHAYALQSEEPKGTDMFLVRVLGYASAVNFATCLPIHFKYTEHRAVLRVCRYVVHGGVAVAAMLLSVYYFVFLPTYDAWGCYPPNVPLAKHNLGMCGTQPGSRTTNWWAKKTTKESEVCIVYFGNMCKPVIPALSAYGAAFTYGHNALFAAIAAYTLGVLFAWESALDDGGPDNPGVL